MSESLSDLIGEPEPEPEGIRTGFRRIDDICNGDPKPEATLAMFLDRSRSARALANWLNARGLSISASTIANLRARMDGQAQ